MGDDYENVRIRRLQGVRVEPDDDLIDAVPYMIDPRCPTCREWASTGCDCADKAQARAQAASILLGHPLPPEPAPPAPEPAPLPKLTGPQLILLKRIVDTNGGGLSIYELFGFQHRTFWKLHALGLIQGKSGEQSLAVHTREGLQLARRG